MKSIFDISSDYLQTISDLENYLTENDTDEVPAHFDEALSINKDELDTKLQNYYFYIEQLKGEAETLKNHAAKISAKKRAIENNIKRLKNYVASGLQLYGEKNKSGNMFYKHQLFKVTATPSSRLKITDETKIPEQYKREVYTVKIDNAQIKKDIKNGANVEGAFIDNTQLNVNFR
jgi:CBS-domain-containing membrane protein